MTVTATETPPTLQKQRFWRRLLTPEQRRFIKFGIVGSSGVIVNLGVVTLCSLVLFASMGTHTFPGIGAVALGDFLALVAGIVVSIMTNFLINDTWTWGDRVKAPGVRPWLRRCRDFYVSNGLAATLQFAVAWGVLQSGVFDTQIFGVALGAYQASIASLVGILIATPLNFIVNNLWTFRDQRS